MRRTLLKRTQVIPQSFPSLSNPYGAPFNPLKARQGNYVIVVTDISMLGLF
jgi:hypothetical protein